MLLVKNTNSGEKDTDNSNFLATQSPIPGTVLFRFA